MADPVPPAAMPMAAACRLPMQVVAVVAADGLRALGAQALSLLCVLDGQCGATASARNDGRAVLAGGQGDLDHFAVFAGLQREELTRATCGKQCRCAVGLQPLQAIGIGLGSKAQFAVEVGQRKGQQAGLQYAFEVLWGNAQALLGESTG